MLKGALLGVVLLALMASSIALVDSRHESRRQFMELSKLERERDQLDVEFGKLKIEQAMLADTYRIEMEAGARLNLRFPDPVQMEMVER